MNMNSPEICVNFTTPKEKVMVPSSSNPNDYTIWAKANNIKLNFANTATLDATKWGKVQQVLDSSGNNVIGQSISKGSSLTIYVYGI